MRARAAPTRRLLRRPAAACAPALLAAPARQQQPRRALWSGVAPVPADPILGLVAAFLEDPSPTKVNLAQGAYRTEEGQPLLLSAVAKAEARVVAAGASKEYLGIEGLPAFVSAAAEFALGADSAALAEGRVASMQTLSGTGSLRVCADMLRLVGGVGEIYLPKPSWGNHAKIFAAGGLEVKEYGYLDAAGTGLDFGLMAMDLAELPRGSVVLLHAAAHNPTGVDPTAEQWDELAYNFAQCATTTAPSPSRCPQTPALTSRAGPSVVPLICLGCPGVLIAQEGARAAVRHCLPGLRDG